MTDNPDFDNITHTDLSNDNRLSTLYVEAVRRKFVPNSVCDVLEFWCFAEKALYDDKCGTPGKLFYSLIKTSATRFITDAQEQRATARLPSPARQALVERAGGSNGLPAPTQVDIENTLFGRDIGYCHGVMMQCFLPQKALPKGRREWQVNHGRASMLVEAGRVIIPEKDYGFRHCDVPAGTKPRFIIPYIIGYAVLHGNREIDMGKSFAPLHEENRDARHGSQWKILTREVENVAAANFYLGEWNKEGGITQFARVAKELSFWIDRDNNQLSFWQPKWCFLPTSTTLSSTIAFLLTCRTLCNSAKVRGGWTSTVGFPTGFLTSRTTNQHPSHSVIYNRSSHPTSPILTCSSNVSKAT